MYWTIYMQVLYIPLTCMAVLVTAIQIHVHVHVHVYAEYKHASPFVYLSVDHYS